MLSLRESKDLLRLAGALEMLRLVVREEICKQTKDLELLPSITITEHKDTPSWLEDPEMLSLNGGKEIYNSTKDLDLLHPTAGDKSPLGLAEDSNHLHPAHPPLENLKLYRPGPDNQKLLSQLEGLQPPAGQRGLSAPLQNLQKSSRALAQ